MDSDIAYRPPEQDSPPPAPSAEATRPTLIIAICSIWIFEIFIGFVRTVRFYFMGSVNLISYLSRQLIIDLVLLAAVKGLWGMRKWGALLFVIVNAAVFALEPRASFQGEWLVLPIATIVVSIRYFRQMR